MASASVYDPAHVVLTGVAKQQIQHHNVKPMSLIDAVDGS
jgi:hypothetical protein